MNRQFFFFFILIVSFPLFSETENKTIEEIILKRNELFAKQGLKFKNTKLDSYFKKFDWYRPKSKSVKLPKQDQELAEKYLRLEKENSLRYSAFLSNGIIWDDSKLEYYENVERSFIKNDSVQNQIDKRTEDVPYRSEEIFITGIRVSGKPNDEKLLASIQTAKSGELEFKKYYTLTPSQDGKFSRISDCSMDSINQEICSTRYVLEKERLLSVLQIVPQTSYVSEWIYIYLEGSLFSTRFYFKSMGQVEKEVVVNNE
ncbi:YARHG domain-containing protein [Leptospira sp. 201903070]|uniref:YARHG domain-containing protein n=1 Tax=Leptospira ainlahdjerensis TaxID=2810033 RepID=A0ABS2UFY3_9LEPT|nr:YARHG domain-containing protein [Leptospira ainlahdjerensis]MBM9578863.1 YARHG domain-containing protein [Leptospira ainlahdjerensis]